MLTCQRHREVCLPGTNEQKRIVAKLDALQARSDAAKQALDAIPPLLERFRQSVLAAAFRGDLTRAWRAQDPDVEPASELLARIRVERRRRWEEANPRKTYVEPEPVDVTGLPELPEGWCWSTPRDIFTWSSGSFLPKKEQQGGTIPVYGGNGVGGHHDRALVELPTLVIGRVGAQCGNVHLSSGAAWITDNAIYAATGTDLAVLAYWRLALGHQNLNANAGGTLTG